MIGTRLSNVCEITMGQAPEGASYNFDGNGLPLLAGAGDFGDLFPSPSKFTTSPGKISKTGDIIVCIRATIGDLNWSDKEYCLGRGVAGLRPKNKELDTQYLWNWLRASKDKLEKNAKGSTFKQISRDDIASLQIPLPPLDEQKRIAEILDKADAVRRKRAESLKLLDELLRATFLDMFGDLLTNNRNWKTEKISAVCETIVDCVNRTAPIVDYETPYKMIRTTNVRNGKVSLKSTRFVEEEVFHRWNRRLYPQQGDVILTREAPVGEVGIINSSDKVFLGQRLMLYRANKAMMTPNFLLHQFQSKYLQHQYDKGGMGSTVKHLPLPTCKSFQVRVPPIELQQKFDLICLRADDYSQKIEECSSESDTLFHSLVARAFKGELTCAASTKKSSAA